MKTVLNVGGNSKAIPLPPQYNGWKHVLLDIDPKVKPDIVCDARDLKTQPESTFDSVYCSHNLEHYHKYELQIVLGGFAHVLKNDGFLLIRVPDIEALITFMVSKNLDIEDVIYDSEQGPITAHDMIYGLGKEIEKSKNSFFAHKTGFTQKSLTNVLVKAGFNSCKLIKVNFELIALATIGEPTNEVIKLFS